MNLKRKNYYLLAIPLLIVSISLFSGTASRIGELLAQDQIGLPHTQVDTLPLFPVTKVQITSRKDLKKKPPIDLRTPANITTKVEYDPNSSSYTFRVRVGDEDISTPYTMTFDEYLDYSLKQSMSNYFKNRNAGIGDTIAGEGNSLIKDHSLNLGSAKNLFSPKGPFGAGGIKLTATGYVEASMGIKHTRIENPTLSERNRSRSSFDFKEDIQMNVGASVGDKIDFGMNYDTKALFDFDTQKLKLGYDGRTSGKGLGSGIDKNVKGGDDGIVKYIEAGNVSMATTNSLIHGGTALFGVSTELQFGKLSIRSILAQQESENKKIDSQGSIQNSLYEFKADQYDENRHFFLGHHFRDNYDKAMSKLPYVQSAINISRIEVWITNKRGDYTQARNIVAFADIAEHAVIKNPSRWSPSGLINAPYNEANNLYATITSRYANARDISQVTALFDAYIEGGLDYEKVESARLLAPSEYTYNAQLGYVSLKSALQADEVLAVAYEYKMNGATYQVGEFSTDVVDKYDAAKPKSGALFAKLLKPVSLSPQSYTWDLMMKNVYYIGASDIQKEGFRFNIAYQSDTVGTYITYIPDGAIKNELLLRVMNLDRLDSRQNTNPDGVFDFVTNYTIQPENGRVYFPVVEPFGSHLRRKIDNPAIADRYVYQELYDSTLTVARQVADKNKIKLYGSFRGSSNSSEISLNATNVAPGSVKVIAAGVLLTEGTDYIVDYISGNVTIINQNLIDANTPIQISLEDRTFGNMQRKTLMGMNLSYDVSKKLTIGGTIMHLYEKPLIMKSEIGNESVRNTLWGLNTSYKSQSQWLTNLVDKIPFVNATQPSQISFDGEFAQMIPGHYQNKDTGGYSYLDDFEAAETRFDIKAPYAWSLAAIPSDKSASALFPESALSNINIGKNRAMLSWFMIDGLFTRKNSSLTPLHIKTDKEQLSNHFVREIYMYELFPKKDIAVNDAAILPVLNLSYYPDQRGPYNLDATNVSQEGSLLLPQKRWAGITRKMDVRDFEASNIEYVEFWLMDPFVYNSTAAIPNEGGDLYLNLGEISEDVLKDGKKFFENGLPTNDDPTAVENTIWGKVPKRQSTVFAFDDNMGAAGRKKQDVGLNGLSTEEEMAYPAYADYVTAYKAKLSPSTLTELLENPFSPINDPSGDNYHFYRGSYYDNNKTSILDRYKYYNGTEGNSPATSDTSEKYSTAARTIPDIEDIDQDNTLNENESYFQYKIELNPSKMKVGDNHIVDSRKLRVPLRDGTEGDITWYQFKIPVRQYDKRIGNIQDFKSIRFMRMFLTNFKQATFLRFGTLQLVRGEWRVYEPTLNSNATPSGNGTLDVATVNIEANSEKKPVNYVLPPGVSRMLDPTQSQMNKENEQALSLRIHDLDPEDARALYKNTNYDFRKYKRLQLFTHAEELINGPQLAKGELTVFIRLGTDYKNNYYEYEMPLSITPAGLYSDRNDGDRRIVWPTENLFDFPLALLKDIKLKRNKEKRNLGSTASYAKLYSEYDPEKPNNKVSVIGNPSLAEVSVIMIGVRNNSRQLKSGEVWINELRLTDFDEQGGWAAQGNLNVALSDLGTVNFSGRKETVGFGALDQSLMERRTDDYSLYNIATNVELGRFLPEKAKVSIPLYYAYSSQKTTPQYDPFDQDVTLNESFSLVSSKAERDSIRSLAQETTSTRSISLNNVKVNIQSKTPMPYDPSNISLGYSYSLNEIKSPTVVYNKTKDYKASFAYSYTPLMKTWEPLRTTNNKSTTAKFRNSIGIHYFPSNVAFNSVITRYYNENMLRDIETYSLGGSNNAQFLSWSQSFYWDRDFNLAWDFTRNLKFSFQSGTRAEIEEPYLQVNKDMNRGDYEIWKDAVTKSIQSLGSPLTYQQITKLSYQLPLRDVPVLNWITSTAGYTSGYHWDRGAKIDSLEMGNTISNNITLELNNRLNLTALYNKSTYLKEVNDRFDTRKKTQESASKQAVEKKEKPAPRSFKQELTLTRDSSLTLTHGLNTKDIEVTAKRDGAKYAVKFKRIDNNTIRITNQDTAKIQLVVLAKAREDRDQSELFKDILAYSARGMMSVRNISINYSKRKETHISGFRPSVGDAFGQNNSELGLTPGLGFAFGLAGGEDYVRQSVANNWLVINDMNINPAIYNKADKIELKALIEPLKGMKIDLRANRENNQRREIQYMYDGVAPMLGGSFSMTTIALATSLKGSNSKNDYHSDAFEKFLSYRSVLKNRLEGQYQGTRYPAGGFMASNAGLVGTHYDPNVGQVDINSGDVLIPAFIAAYTGKNPQSTSLSAFPTLLSILPNWNLSYDGLSSIAAVKEKVKSLTFHHDYSCFYQVGNYSSFSNWVGASDDLGYIRNILSGMPIPSSPYNVSSVSIVELFNPLIGISSTLNNGMTINAQVNNMRTLNLQMASYQIIELYQHEWVVGCGYRINEFNKLIGISSKKANTNNDLNIKADLSNKKTQTLIRKIEEQFTQATSGTTTITLKISADYTLSRSLTLRAFFDRIMNNPIITSAGYPITNSNFGVSLRFTLVQ